MPMLLYPRGCWLRSEEGSTETRVPTCPKRVRLGVSVRSNCTTSSPYKKKHTLGYTNKWMIYRVPRVHEKFRRLKE